MIGNLRDKEVFISCFYVLMNTYLSIGNQRPPRWLLPRVEPERSDVLELRELPVDVS